MTSFYLSYVKQIQSGFWGISVHLIPRHPVLPFNPLCLRFLCQCAALNCPFKCLQTLLQAKRLWIMITKGLPMLGNLEKSGGLGGLDRYKQRAINPGAYSLESFAHKLQSPGSRESASVMAKSISFRTLINCSSTTDSE